MLKNPWDGTLDLRDVRAVVATVIAQSSGAVSPTEEAFAQAVADACEGPWAEPSDAGRVRILADYLREAADLMETVPKHRDDEHDTMGGRRKGLA